jgi:hypothetical protein
LVDVITYHGSTGLIIISTFGDGGKPHIFTETYLSTIYPLACIEYYDQSGSA